MTNLQLKKEFDTYLPMLSNKQQEVILNTIKSILWVDEGDKRLTIEEYNRELDESEKEIKEGRFKTQAQVVKLVKKWQKGR